MVFAPSNDLPSILDTNLKKGHLSALFNWAYFPPYSLLSTCGHINWELVLAAL